MDRLIVGGCCFAAAGFSNRIAAPLMLVESSRMPREMRGKLARRLARARRSALRSCRARMYPLSLITPYCMNDRRPASTIPSLHTHVVARMP